MTSEEQFIGALIASVEKHPVLYKVDLSDYKNKNKKGEAFKEVQREIREAGCSDSQVQSTYKKWISLKRKFRVEYFRLKSEENSGKNVASAASNFRFFDALTFLIPYCEFYESLKSVGKKRKLLDDFETTNATAFMDEESEDEQSGSHFDEDESYTPTILDKLLMNKSKKIKFESAEVSGIFSQQSSPSALKAEPAVDGGFQKTALPNVPAAEMTSRPHFAAVLNKDFERLANGIEAPPPQSISNLGSLLLAASPADAAKAAESHAQVVEKLFTSPLTSLFAPTKVSSDNNIKITPPKHKTDGKERPIATARRSGILDGLLSATTSSSSSSSSSPEVDREREKERSKEEETAPRNLNGNNPSLPDSPKIFVAKESQNALFGRLVASEIDKLPEGLHNIVRAEVLLLLAQATSATSNFNFGQTSSIFNGEKPFTNLFGYNC